MSLPQPPLVVAIVGPTGSGKTALSIQLALQLKAEVVACDSRTVFRHMNIGTAKPTHQEMLGVPHHMLDLIDPDHSYTVAQYAQAASLVVNEILSQGKLPIVCGGTGFYARALLEGLNLPSVSPQPEFRVNQIEFAQQNGNRALWDKLALVDPLSAQKINHNDLFRIIRALEVAYVTGEPLSKVATKSNPPYQVLWIGITPENREELYVTLAQRFQRQLDNGLIEETQALYSKYGTTSALAKTVNYKQLLAYCQGQIDLTSASENAIKSNRNLAQRQLVWFRANPSIQWIYTNPDSDPLQKSLAIIEKHLSQ